MARYKVDQDVSGRYLVTYVPVEVGQYNVIIKWNGYEIEGTNQLYPVLSADDLYPCTIFYHHHRLDIIDQVEYGVHDRLHICPLCG